MEAQPEATPEPSVGALDESPQAEDESLEEEQERAMVPPTVTSSPEPEPTGEMEELQVPAVPSGGPARELLRWIEIGLAGLVIVLAGWTYRLRPRGE